MCFRASTRLTIYGVQIFEYYQHENNFFNSISSPCKINRVGDFDFNIQVEQSKTSSDLPFQHTTHNYITYISTIYNLYMDLNDIKIQLNNSSTTTNT